MSESEEGIAVKNGSKTTEKFLEENDFVTFQIGENEKLVHPDAGGNRVEHPPPREKRGDGENSSMEYLHGVEGPKNALNSDSAASFGDILCPLE